MRSWSKRTSRFGRFAQTGGPHSEASSKFEGSGGHLRGFNRPQPAVMRTGAIPANVFGARSERHGSFKPDSPKRRHGDQLVWMRAFESLSLWTSESIIRTWKSLIRCPAKAAGKPKVTPEATAYPRASLRSFTSRIRSCTRSLCPKTISCIRSFASIP